MKQHLNVVSNNIIPNTTCFAEHERCNKTCKKCDCRHWLDNKQYNNCVIIAANDGPHTLQDIGEMFELTRMRICQIEKNVRAQLLNVLRTD